MTVALCDFDEAYTGALTEFLLKKTSCEISAYTNVEDFLVAMVMGQGRFEYGILGREFFEEAQRRLSQDDSLQMQSINIEEAFKTLVILDSYIGCDCDVASAQIVYKFGSMENLLSILSEESKSRACKSFLSKKGRIFSLYSPMHHELTELFSLSFAQMLAEEGSVLFVDLTENPMIKEICSYHEKNSLVDCVYRLESDSEASLDSSLEYYGSVAVFPVASSPLEMCEITLSQWKKLIGAIQGFGFDNIVFCFDEINQGFAEVMSITNRLILVNRSGDFYEHSRANFFRALSGSMDEGAISDVILPMSANSLNKGEYQLEELLVGNLGKYVRSVNYGF